VEGFYGCSTIREEPFFPTSNLIANIKKANYITGKTFRIKGGYYYLGSKTFKKQNKDISVGFVFIPNIGDSKLVKMLGIKCLCRENDIVVTLMPTIKIEDVNFKSILHNHFIVQESLANVLDQENYKLPIQEIIKPLMECETEESSLKIFGAVNSDGYHRIEFFGRTIELTDSYFIMLLRLALGVLKNANGWVSVGDLTIEGIVTEYGYKQSISRFRRKMKDCLGDKANDLVQSGRKKYRLNLSADFVEVDRERLKAIQNGRIRSVVEKM